MRGECEALVEMVRHEDQGGPGVAPLAKERAEIVIGAAVVEPGGSLIIYNDDRSKTYSFSELKEYQGSRAQRGAVITRGWRKVTRVESGN